MSLNRSKAELLVIAVWVLALGAAGFLADSRAAFVTIMGAGFGAATVYQAVRRRWWPASGTLSLGTGILLNAVTEGTRSQARHNVASAVSLATIAYFMVTVVAERRAAERNAKLSDRPGKDGP